MGYQRSAYYKHFERAKERKRKEQKVLKLVSSIRKNQPRVGTRKLHKELESGGKVIIGRDRLFALLRKENALVPRKKRYQKTTYSNHNYAVAPNRIKNLVVTRPNQVLVSDITYLALVQGHAYLFLVTDLFSRKILGYHLSKDLSHHSALLALNMALSLIPNPEGVIHHSDRGCQYCCHEFLNFLSFHKMIPSMTAEAHCYENAVAERVNGILKSEFNLDQPFPDFYSAKNHVHRSINTYNSIRLHWSLDLSTPDYAYATAA